MKFEIKNIPVSKLEPNTGQIEGLPKNPRFIRDERYEKLKQSLTDDPEMLQLRELIVFPNGEKYVVICGNMRYRISKDQGHKEITCKILPSETPAEKLRAYTIKDNISFGNSDWDILANEWDTEELTDWGMLNMGFTDELDKVNGENKEWVGMPEFEPADNPYKIIINFDSEHTMKEYAETNKIPFLKKETKAWSTWYPFREQNDLKSLKYE